jgi:hypothetical protein
MNNLGKFSFNLAVLDAINGKAEEAIKQKAFQVEAQAKANVVANDQIDTGFMLNSIHTNFNKSELPSGAVAAIYVGAEYGIWQEFKNPFLYPALRSVTSG